MNKNESITYTATRDTLHFQLLLSLFAILLVTVHHNIFIKKHWCVATFHWILLSTKIMKEYLNMQLV